MRSQLLPLFAAAKLTPLRALQTSNSPAKAPRLRDPAARATVIAAMLDHRGLVNRFRIRSPKGVRRYHPRVAVPDIIDREGAKKPT